jgi:hypothetical protein
VDHIGRTDSVHPREKETTSSRGQLNKPIQKALFVLAVGLFGALIAGSVYPLLDRRAVGVIVVVLFLLPFAVYMALAVRKRVAANIVWLRRVFSCCGAALFGLAAFLGLNGLLDRVPAQFVHTSIIHKYVSYGRGGSDAHVVDVSSWRPGHDEEHLQVSSAQYRSVRIGDLVVIEVHSGRFGLPWYRLIAP